MSPPDTASAPQRADAARWFKRMHRKPPLCGGEPGSARFFLDFLTSALYVFAHAFHRVAAGGEGGKRQDKRDPQVLFHLISPVVRVGEQAGAARTLGAVATWRCDPPEPVPALQPPVSNNGSRPGVAAALLG